MKASELRIGNSIMQDDDLVFVTTWRLKLIEDKSLDYKPIPLTEEWLLKFGMGIESVLCITCVDVLLTIEYKYNHTTKTMVIHIHDKPLIHVRYVHQLQNLYFALTGEELTIKDEVY